MNISDIFTQQRRERSNTTFRFRPSDFGLPINEVKERLFWGTAHASEPSKGLIQMNYISPYSLALKFSELALFCNISQQKSIHTPDTYWRISKKGTFNLINSNESQENELKYPTHCPLCGSTLHTHGDTAQCPNHDHCPAQIPSETWDLKALGYRDNVEVNPNMFELKKFQQLADEATAHHCLAQRRTKGSTIAIIHYKSINSLVNLFFNLSLKSKR